MMNRMVLKTMVLSAVLVGVTGYVWASDQVGAGEVAYRTIDSGTFQSFVKNWDDAADPVLYALIRNPAEWDAVFHPAPVMGGNRPFAPEESLYEKEQILVVAKVAQSSATLTLGEVVADGEDLHVSYSFAEGESDKSYMMKKHLLVVLPKSDCKQIRLIENGTQVGALNVAKQKIPSCEEVTSAVEAWIDGLDGTVYKATLRASDEVSPLPSTPINDHLFAFREGNLYIGLGFSEPPSSNSTLEELRATFKHIALDRIPVPGVEATNWETRLQTPRSSFKEGVTLESWKDGVLRIRVQTEFFAAYGRRTDIRIPADARMPKGTYFQIRQPIKADLVIEGRLFDVRLESWAKPVALEGVPNLHKVTDNLYRSAQPSKKGMSNLKEMGVETVVNLRSFNSDRSEIGDTGLGYEHIYMKAWHPERKEVIRFLQIATHSKRTPVLVHCKHGADRTGTMCALYRIVVQDWTKEAAIKEMADGGYGFHEIFENLPKWIDELDTDALRKEVGISEPQRL